MGFLRVLLEGFLQRFPEFLSGIFSEMPSEIVFGIYPGFVLWILPGNPLGLLQGVTLRSFRDFLKLPPGSFSGLRSEFHALFFYRDSFLDILESSTISTEFPLGIPPMISPGTSSGSISEFFPGFMI